MIKTVYRNAWNILRQKPFRLWGISLMSVLLMALASILGVLPIISIPLAVLVQVGGIWVYLKAYRGESVASEDLFIAFKQAGRFAGGMLWMLLWILLWSLIPIAGLVFAVMKTYEYRFVPYLLLTQPDLPAAAALKLSGERTKGYRTAMFWGDVLLVAGIAAVSILLGLFSIIPVAGVLFGLVLALFSIVAGALYPLMAGLLGAGYYESVASGEAAAIKQQAEAAKQAAAEAAARVRAEQQAAAEAAARARAEQEAAARAAAAQQAAAQQAAGAQQPPYAQPQQFTYTPPAAPVTPANPIPQPPVADAAGAAAAAAGAGSWTCGCGAVSNGMFCPNCGSRRP